MRKHKALLASVVLKRTRRKLAEKRDRHERNAEREQRYLTAAQSAPNKPTKAEQYNMDKEYIRRQIADILSRR